MKKVTYKPFGSRLLVDPITTTLSLEERGRKIGIEVIVEQENVPRPTQGRVVALGSDPLLHESVKVGDIVFFHYNSGHGVTLQGHEFRQLEISEITGILSEEEEVSEHESGSEVTQPR